MPRFVVLRHVMPDSSPRGTHFDLMFEMGESLATWACEQLPPPSPVAACRLSDHRLAYLTYEGPISGGRGSVERVDSGTYEPLETNSHCWRLQVAGSKLYGLLVFSRIDDSDRWAVEWAASSVG